MDANNSKVKRTMRSLWKRRRKLLITALVVLISVSFVSTGYAFFSDFLEDSFAGNSGCIQVTPTLKIDGQTGDRMNEPLQSKATCIPPRYTQIESLVFNNQYIDTGIKGSSTLTVVADAQFASTTVSNGYLFGTRDCTGPACTTKALIFGSVPAYEYYINGNTGATSVNLDGQRHVFTYTNGPMKVDGVIPAPALNMSPSAPWSSNNNVLLGTYNNDGSPSGSRVKATVYDFQIYDGSTLVRHMVPAFDNQTGECGMFDVVSGSFFQNLGAEAFSCVKPQTANPNCDNLSCNGQNQGDFGVVYPNTIHQFSYTLANTGTIDYINYTGDRIAGWLNSRYVAVDYLQFDGSNYIDTGVDPSGNTLAVSTDFQFTTLPVSGGVNFVFGARYSPSVNALSFYVQQASPANYTNLQYGASVVNSLLGGIPNTLNRCGLSINITPGSKIASIANCGNPNSLNFTAMAPPAAYTNNTMYIGGVNSNNSFNTNQSFKGRIYSFKITKPTVSRNFAPAYDTVTGQCGLYDSVSNAFFGKGGTSTDLTPAKGSCVPPTTSRVKILLYPSTVSNSVISGEVAAMTAGVATISPSAIATLDGSACSATFYGTDTGITPVCMTSVLPGTLNTQTNVGDSQTYNYKFVVWVPAGLSSVYENAEVKLGVSSGVQGVPASNWKQQVHPYIGTFTADND